jgi:CysZ protein
VFGSAELAGADAWTTSSAMLIALYRAVYALSTPPLRRIVALSLALALLTFVLLWLAVASVLYNTALFEWRPLNWLTDVMGGLAVLALSWLFYPAVVTLIMSLFLERVAAAVEALDYPGLGPPRRQPIREILGAMLRLTGLTLLLNLLALPAYLLLPAINLFLFLALNGYLLGREYFEVVALRRLDAAATRAARNRFGLRVFLGGVVIAALFALPLVNLVAPVVATAFMLHLFEALHRTSSRIP